MRLMSNGQGSREILAVSIWADYSIYVKQLNTGKEAGINQDQEMYSASVTKLHIFTMCKEQLNQKNFP